MRNIFLKSNNALLRKRALEISADKINSKKILDFSLTLLRMAYGEQKDPKRAIMVGLAAPQIGISKRIILVDVKADGKGKVGELKIFINPEIIWSSKKMAEWYEGCYSIPGVCGIVLRPSSIKIKGIILRFERNQPLGFEARYTGYVARIFQHEIDHLDGKLFVDLIKNPDHLHWVKKSEFPLYRNKEAWRNWPKKYPLPLGTIMSTNCTLLKAR